MKKYCVLTLTFVGCLFRIKFLHNSGVPGPRKRPLQTGLIWRTLECPIVVTRTMNLKRGERQGQGKHKIKMSGT